MQKQLRVDSKVQAHAQGEVLANRPLRDGVDTMPLRKSALLNAQRNTLRHDASVISNELPGAAARLEQKHAELEKATDQFRMGRGGGLPGTKVHGDLPIENGFTDHLIQNTQQNGFYRLGLKSDEGGHVIGLHKTDGECRLMDANTAEWSTKNHKDMCNLVTEHINELYLDRNYNQFDLTHYKQP
jgi:hypothetical protein